MIKLKDIKMKPKLIGLFLIAGIVPLAIVGWWSSRLASEALMEKSYGQLEAVRGIKKAQVEKYFEERQGDMGVLMDTVGTLRQEAFNKLQAVQTLKKAHIEDYFETMSSGLQGLKDDPYTLNALIEINRVFNEAGDKVLTPRWNAVAEKYDARMKGIMEDNGWYDIFLIHPDGDIVYTATRESDLGMDIPGSELSGQGIGKAFKNAKSMGREDIAVADFEPYSPSNGAQAAFMMAQMRDAKGKLRGYVAFQVPTDNINQIVQQREGMGTTGESYLVGKLGDKTAFRSDLLTMGNGKYVIGYEIHTEYIDDLIRDMQSFQKLYTDSAGNLVMITADPLNFKGLHWGIISKINAEEAFAPKMVGETDDFYAKYIKKYGYYDLFLINPNGYCFYTVAQESDYRTNFLNGKFSDSNLASLFKKAISSKQFAMADFAPYAPSNNEPCGFIAQPVVTNGRVEVVVALQLPLDAINSMMQEREGMGETGETYLVGPDKLMRSDSFLDPQGHTVKASFAGTLSKNGVDTEAASDALSGNTDAKVIMDYNGNPVLSAYTPLEIGNITWALISEIDEAEVLGPVNSLKKAIAIIGVILALIVAALGFFIARSIANPIIKSAELADTIATGDLEKTIDIDQQDEVGILAGSMMKMTGNLKKTVEMAGKIAAGDLTVEVKTLSDKDALGHALKDMVEKLGSVMDNINTSSSNVAAGSEEMSSTSQSMSQGATEQASSLEEISSSMNEIGSQTKQNAENASQANQLAGDTKNAAESGNSQMKEMVEAMTEINTSSQEISKIIKTIDEIAFQTNLLALNAAVEAARAGKQGKGFAVVAEEVRNLAARSAKAAKETADMIEGSVKKVEGGTEIANKTAEALGEIVGSVTKVTDIVGEIAAASNEQAQGISQITQGLSQVDQVTQQNTAHAEESASAAEELASQAQLLQELVATFKLASAKGAGSQTGAGNNAQVQNKKMITGRTVTKDSGSGAEDTWGGAQETPKVQADKGPEPTINLDDEEFGKY